MRRLRRVVLWLAMNLPETRFTPRLMAFGLGASSYRREG